MCECNVISSFSDRDIPCVPVSLCPVAPLGALEGVGRPGVIPFSREKIKKALIEIYLLTRVLPRVILSTQTKRKEEVMMKSTEIVKAIMGVRGITNGKLGSAIERNADVVNKRLNQKELTAGVLAEMVNAMGYKVVVMEVTTKTPEGSYVVDAEKVGKAGIKCE